MLAGACSAASSEHDLKSWTPPSWFAEHMQEREEYQAELQGCLDRQGWTVTVDADGGVLEPLEEVEMARLVSDVDRCREAMGLPTGDPGPSSAEDLRSLHAMLLDTWECLRVHGAGMATPPSEETFVDEAQRAEQGDETAEVWHPYADPALNRLKDDERRRALEACPQPWS